MAKKQKYYVVWQGAEPGIYNSWAACQAQIKGYPNAKYKAFNNKAEAEAAFHGNYDDNITRKVNVSVDFSENAQKDIVWDSISVDAACSGNPGVMEYQGVDTKTKFQFFHKKFDLGTNNIGEFLAIVHALAMFKKDGKDTPIYTDSRNAMKWVREKKCKTTLVRNAKTEIVWQLIERAEKWLQSNTYPNKIMKWETEKWGEIPADFGRK
ncbi:MAG: ribonuclease H family protein [Saprospiraceae bacterium]|nr:ribonuclease H family protein [Saprospiraceae bacterium]